MNINTYYILVESNQFYIAEYIPLIPVISIEKLNSFQLPAIQPYNNQIECDLINCGCRLNSFIWISHNKKAIYFENPKAGSSSIKASLGFSEPDLTTCLVRIFSEWYNVKKYLIRVIDHFNTLSENIIKESLRSINEIIKYKTEFINNQPFIYNYSERDNFEMYYGNPLYLIDRFADYFAFSFSRDPLKKLVSNYLMFKQKKFRISQLELLYKKTNENLDWEEFLNIIQKINNHHWNKQCLFIPEFINRFPNNYIGKLEHYETDWELICRRINIDYVCNHINKTEVNELNNSNLSFIISTTKKIYKDDYYRFNYK